MARRTTDTTPAPSSEAAPTPAPSSVDEGGPTAGVLGEIAALRREVVELRREIDSLRERDVTADVQAVRDSFELDPMRVVHRVRQLPAIGEDLSGAGDLPEIPAIMIARWPDPTTGKQLVAIATLCPRDGLRTRVVALDELT